jgi:hypothetical protein
MIDCPLSLCLQLRSSVRFNFPSSCSLSSGLSNTCLRTLKPRNLRQFVSLLACDSAQPGIVGGGGSVRARVVARICLCRRVCACVRLQLRAVAWLICPEIIACEQVVLTQPESRLDKDSVLFVARRDQPGISAVGGLGWLSCCTTLRGSTRAGKDEGRLRTSQWCTVQLRKIQALDLNAHTATP